ncbi:hypothetical protein AVEN_184533-1 [Araneus ventricosus]|uniref:Uncharacterized protein n=1 Tax=Araneus ventricosus TaxID=182803 RepID=A0A4Y2JMM0_ARAVE|nr:hypothetical protein AVEN_184533-1 [Araneus ventricosus]
MVIELTWRSSEFTRLVSSVFYSSDNFRTDLFRTTVLFAPVDFLTRERFEMRAHFGILKNVDSEHAMSKRSYYVLALMKTKPLMFLKFKKFVRYPLQMPQASHAQFALFRCRRHRVRKMPIKGSLRTQNKCSRIAKPSSFCDKILLPSW